MVQAHKPRPIVDAKTRVYNRTFYALFMDKVSSKNVWLAIKKEKV
jgi:hypothetical protein